MGIWQSFKNKFKPVPMKAKAYHGNRSYRGGSLSSGAKYPFGFSGDGNGYTIDHYRTRQNSRTIVHESVQAKSLVKRFADSVVDTGLRLEPTPDFKVLGIDPEIAREWAQQVESRFDLWASSKKSSRSEINNFYQNQHLYNEFMQRDGDMFTRIYYNNESDAINPVQIQFIDPDQIRGDSYTTSWGQYSQTDGIERDPRGREKSYKIWERKPDFTYNYVTVPRFGARSKRVFMLHGFNPEFAGQMRGYSPIAHALQEFQNITDFSLAKIKKAINQSNITMYVKPSPDNTASNPFGDLAKDIAGPAVDMFSTAPSAEEIATANNELVSYCAINEVDLQQPGSTGVFSLNEGEDLKPFEDKANIDSWENFVNAFVSHLSASMSMPVEVLLMKFGSNYSASRAALVMFWRIAQIQQAEMNADFNNPIYESWLSEEIASGRVQAPGWNDPILKAAWLSCNWIGAPMPNIDPGKEAKAQKEYLDMSATTIKRVARQTNGSNAERNIAENAKIFPSLPATPWGQGSVVESPEMEEEEENKNG